MNSIMCSVCCAISSENHSFTYVERCPVNLPAHHIPSMRDAMLTSWPTNPLKIPNIADAAIMTRMIISNIPKSIAFNFSQK